MKNLIKELKTFIILWSTQSLSGLGSSMTRFALTLWLYEKTGSALQTSLLAICSYAPYVLISIFAGALTDRWDKKRIMLVCDSLAAVCSVAILILLKSNLLMPSHMYILNVISGLMSSVQEPAAEVSMTAVIPKRHYQKTGGMRSFSSSLITILSPIAATALYALAGLETVIYVDLLTFAVAFAALAFCVKIPPVLRTDSVKKESVMSAAKSGLRYLNQNRMILMLIFFLAGVNFVASAFDAALPALILPRANGGQRILGIVTSCAGVASLIGSVIATFLPKPRDRVRVIFVTMLISLGTENFLLAFSKSPVLWCIGQIIGWLFVPVMNANLDVVMRTYIPIEMQGRVYSCRNSLQFFTIPLGLFAGGFIVDNIFEPIAAVQSSGGLLFKLFGNTKGSGAAMTMLVLGILGVSICLIFKRILKRYTYTEE